MSISVGVTTVEFEDERAITQLIYRAAQAADDRQFMVWMDLFAEEGEYAAITRENLASGLYLFRDRGKRALQERAAYQIGIWQVPRGEIVHLVGNIMVAATEGEGLAAARSNFIITRTADMEHSKLYAAGQYHDTFEKKDGAWLFKVRRVIVSSNMLPAEFTELL
jgi:3-phenylpropionate/cinnamic acid dioxygenase small subunit